MARSGHGESVDSVCVSVCVGERETDRQTETEGKRERERAGGVVFHHVKFTPCDPTTLRLQVVLQDAALALARLASFRKIVPGER